jgi:hypothetical protein
VEAGVAIPKGNTGFFECSRRWCASNELHKSWSVEYDIIDEEYLQFVETGGIDAGHKVLQIFGDPPEPKI